MMVFCSLHIFIPLITYVLPLPHQSLHFPKLGKRKKQWEGGGYCCTCFSFCSVYPAEVALTEHRTDTEINPTGTTALEVVLTQNQWGSSAIPINVGTYIFLPFCYSFLPTCSEGVMRGTILVHVSHKPLLSLAISIYLFCLNGIQLLSNWMTAHFTIIYAKINLLCGCDSFTDFNHWFLKNTPFLFTGCKLNK